MLLICAADRQLAALTVPLQGWRFIVFEVLSNPGHCVTVAGGRRQLLTAGLTSEPWAVPCCGAGQDGASSAGQGERCCLCQRPRSGQRLLCWSATTAGGEGRSCGQCCELRAGAPCGGVMCRQSCWRWRGRSCRATGAARSSQPPLAPSCFSCIPRWEAALLLFLIPPSYFGVWFSNPSPRTWRAGASARQLHGGNTPRLGCSCWLCSAGAWPELPFRPACPGDALGTAGHVDSGGCCECSAGAMETSRAGRIKFNHRFTARLPAERGSVQHQAEQNRAEKSRGAAQRCCSGPVQALVAGSDCRL